MLVSPPSALWNVLTTSTTSLVVVSPSAAALLSPHARSPSKKGKNQSVSRPGQSPSLQPRAILMSPGMSKWASTDKHNEMKVEESLRSLVQQPFVSPVAIKTQENPNVSLEEKSHREKETRHGEILLTRHPSPTEQSTELESSTEEMNSGVEAVPGAAQAQHCPLNNPRSIADNVTTEPSDQTDTVRKELGPGSLMGADFAKDKTCSKLIRSEVSQRRGDNQLALSKPTSPENVVCIDLSDNFRDEKSKRRFGEKELSSPEDPLNRRGKSGVAMDLSNLFTGSATLLPKRQPKVLCSRFNDRQANAVRSLAASVDKSIKIGSRQASKPAQALEQSSATKPQQRDSEIADNSDVPDAHSFEGKVALLSLCKKATAATPSSQKKDVDSWADKQSETFVCWLNFTFKPTEDMEHENKIELNSYSPTRSAGLRTLLVHRRMAQPRLKASVLFRSQGMSKIRQIVFDEIVKGSLSLRSDRDLYADLGLREQIISLLLSYATPWLQLGLEVIFGEIILPALTDSQLASTTKANGGRRTSESQMVVALQTFLTSHVLSDAAVLAKYTKGKCKVPSGKFEKQYRSEMRDLVLYRLMVLIFFLDRAKEKNILDKEPRLFSKSSSVKSSSDVLLALCRGFLSSEGNLIKHLSRIGLTVSYKQDRVDELEYSVTNLAVDLRDGVRLTKMAEILTDALPKSFMATLRLPAVSRLQKMHNVGTAMSSLRDFGVDIPDDVHTHHIVDGHREMVLKLMWSVIVQCCLPRLLALHQVEQEIRNVLRSNQARRRVQGTTAWVKVAFEFSETTLVEKSSPEQVLKSLLFRWCQAVCSCFDLQLLDFTTSFADGKAFCYLVNYYHPSLISLDEILPTTRDKCHRLSVEVLLSNERKNSAMACRRVCELGGIPKMIPITDVNNPPSEECTLLCLAYLCSRLTESSKEILATILIQACYRKFTKREAARKIWKAWNRNKDAYYHALSRRYASAVWILEEFILTHKKALARLKGKRLMNERRLSSAISIQCVYRGRLGRLRARSMHVYRHASSVILRSWRGFTAMKQYHALLAKHYSAGLIQRIWRGVHCRMHMQLLDHAAIQLQRIARGYLSKRQLGLEHCAAVAIQNVWWGLVAHRKREASAILLQSLWRQISARTESAVRMLRRDAVIELQRVWRGCYRRLLFQINIQSVILIQKVLRGHRVRKEVSLRRYRIAATTIQNMWRGFSAQLQYQLDLLDIVSIQNFTRRKIAIGQYLRKMYAISTLQRAFRSASARQLMRTRLEQRESDKQRHFAATTVQVSVSASFSHTSNSVELLPHRSLNLYSNVVKSALRSWHSRKEIFHLKRTFICAIRIQCLWRRTREIKSYTRVMNATTSIQAVLRSVSVRRKTRLHSKAASLIQYAWRVHKREVSKKASATEIQRIWRGSLSLRSYKSKIQGAVRVQTMWRRTAALHDFRRKNVSATALQTEWRRYWAQYNFSLDILEIIIVQSAVRRRQAVEKAARRREAILIVQKAVRRYQAKGKYFRRRASGILLQALFRRKLAVKLAATRRVAIHHILVVRHQLEIEKVSRHCTACLCLQCFFRQRQAKGVVSRRRKACVSIQTNVRRVLAQSIAYTRRRSIVLIQASTRKRSAIRTASERMRSLLVLQRTVRREQARFTLSRTRAAAQLLQSYIRKRLAETIASKRRVAVLTIQTAIRRRLKFKKSRTRLVATVVIQGAMRRALAALQYNDLKETKFRSQVLVKAAIVCQVRTTKLSVYSLF
jgi:abnormal spindle-like microcephaly-associated protein